MTPYPVGSRRFIWLIGALTGLTALSIDISLPALPLIGAALSADAQQTQLTLSAFLLGYSVSQLFIGPLSDSLGRKPVLLASLALFMVAGVGCTLATDIDALIAFRVAQGIGGSAGTILGRAIVRDTHSDGEAARMLALVTQVMFVAPMVAPLIGQGLLELGTWRLPFGVLALVGVACIAAVVARLGESLPTERRKPLSALEVARTYARFFREPLSLVPAIVVCCAFAGQFAYISSSAFVMTEVFGVPRRVFPLFFGANALMLMVGSRTAARLTKQRTPRQVLQAGARTMALGAAGLIAGTVVRDGGIIAYVTSVAVFFVGIGMTTPSAIAVAMEPWKSAAGLAASALGAAQMAGGSGASAFTAALYDGSARPVGVVMAGAGTIVAALALGALRLGAAQSGALTNNSATRHDR